MSVEIDLVGTIKDEDVFTRIYDQNLWYAGSGYGSNPAQAEPYLEKLQEFFDNHEFKTIIDLGCGDWRLMERIDIPDAISYKGFDVVKSVIDTNINNYQQENVQFFHIHQLSDFLSQSGDLLILKDILMHWPNKQINYLIDNILPNFKYTLITHDYNQVDFNKDIPMGKWRALDIEAAPFNLNNNLKPILTYPSHGIEKKMYLYKS